MAYNATWLVSVMLSLGSTKDTKFNNHGGRQQTSAAAAAAAAAVAGYAAAASIQDEFVSEC